MEMLLLEAVIEAEAGAKTGRLWQKMYAIAMVSSYMDMESKEVPGLPSHQAEIMQWIGGASYK